MKLVKNNNEEQKTKTVSDKDAEEAFKTILKWMVKILKERACWKHLKE